MYKFTLDGKEQQSEDSRTAAEILAAGGVDPSEHYLVKVVRNKQVKYSGADHVELFDGQRFVSIYTGPTPCG